MLMNKIKKYCLCTNNLCDIAQCFENYKLLQASTQFENTTSPPRVTLGAECEYQKTFCFRSNYVFLNFSKSVILAKIYTYSQNEQFCLLYIVYQFLLFKFRYLIIEKSY